MTTKRHTITKLATDGSNWVTYRDCMVVTFRARQWSDHFTNTTTSPNYTAAGVINGHDPNQRWALDKDLAIDLISNTIPDQVFNRVKSHTTVMETWNTIKKIHQDRSKIATINLGLKMQGPKLTDDGDAIAHIQKLLDLCEQLAALGKNVVNNEFASTLMGSLPSSYRSVNLALSAAANQANSQVTPTRAIRLITDEYKSRIHKQGRNGSNEAFTIKTQKKLRDKRNVECYNCHRLGHIKANCWAKRGDKEGQRPPQRTDNNQNNDNQNRGRGNDNNRNRNNNRRNNENHQADTNSANADIEAWAAIKGN